MYPWNSAIFPLKVFLQCELWLSLRSSFGVKAFPCNFSFFFFFHVSMNNDLTDLRWSLIKSVFPLKAFLVSAFTEFVSMYTFRHVMKLESFVHTYNEARKASPHWAYQFFQHVFIERKYEVRITKGTTTVTVIHQFYLLGKFLNLLRAHNW